tara:strand:+ start:4390 stop:5409 length:1020 start_codon:yes stop_codon:yes gene_type:complete
MIIRSKAPLRLGLAGGGTDLDVYCDKYTGYVLNVTIDLFVHCTIETTKDEKIIFKSLDLKQKFESKSKKNFQLDGEMDLYKAIYNKVIKDFVKKKVSLKVITYSDVPSGSGLGGSSTLVVSILQAFVKLFNLPLGEYDIARYAFEIEREHVGIIGGAQDQYASTFGGFNFMEFYRKKRVIVNPLKINRWIIDELESSIVLYYTNISRKASQIEEEKKSIMHSKKSLDAMHLVKKNALLMKEFLLKGELLNFADFLGKSWESKKNVSNVVTNNEIDKIYKKAIKLGAYAGKVSGAGGGGFMFFIIDPIKKYTLCNELSKEKGRVINFNFFMKGAKAWKIR